MYFREQGRKVQCIRTRYDPAIGRSRQKVVATFDRTLKSVPGTLLHKLPRDESEALFNWWRARVSRRAIEEKKKLCENATEHLRALEQALRWADAETLDYEGIRGMLPQIERELRSKEKEARRIQRSRAKQAALLKSLPKAKQAPSS